MDWQRLWINWVQLLMKQEAVVDKQVAVANETGSS